MNLPNKLTISRILLTFVFMFFLFYHGVISKVLALSIFLLASITDWWDGRLARARGEVTNLGKLLDPIADKILTLGAFLAFVELKLVPAWMVVLILVRELAVTGLRLFALGRREVLPAQSAGKHKTISQMCAIIIILIGMIIKAIGLRMDWWTDASEQIFKNGIFSIMLVTCVLTLISGGAYLWRNRKVLLSAKIN